MGLADESPTLYSAARVPHSVPSRAYARGTTPASPACTTRREPTSPTPATPCTRQALGATTDETTTTGVAQAVVRCELPPARSSATAADLARLPTSWRDTYAQMQRPLRAAQADLLAETYSRRDYIGVAATGSGKGAVWLVPAGAEARAALIGTEPRALCPVNLVVVPLSAQGPLHEEEACVFLQAVCRNVMPTSLNGEALHWWPRAVYVDRGGAGPAAAGVVSAAAAAPPPAPTVPVCPRGHPLHVRSWSGDDRNWAGAQCDSCGATIGRGQPRAECRWAAGPRAAACCDYDLCMPCHAQFAEPAATASGAGVVSPGGAAPPAALPCGVCAACAGASTPGRPGPAVSSCKWTCKFWRPGAREQWCSPCQNNQSKTRCLERKALPTATQAATTSVAPPTSSLDDTTPNDTTNDSTPPEADGGERRQLGFHERAIAEDYSVRVVIVTASALGSSEPGGRALRGVLAERGIRRLVIDEVHALSPTSMAVYSAALASFVQTVELIRANLARAGRERPQVIGVTSTLPPASAGHVKRLAGMTSSATTIRCNIDRPELHFQLTPLPLRPGEPQAAWLQRVLLWHACHLPAWALEGGIVVFCGTAVLAAAAALSVQLPKPCGAGHRPAIAYLGTTKLTAAQRREAITRFESERHAILFTTEAWSHGAGRAGVHLVIHADLGRSVLDFWQRSGRAAREGGERAIVSQLYDARLLAQRARLCAPCKADSVSMHADTLALCRYLTARGCVRQCLLGALGQAQCAVPCGACYNCARDGAGAASLAALPHLFEWVEATAASAAFLDGDPRLLRGDGGGSGGCTLSQLIASPWSDAEPPFNGYLAHNVLVLQLLAARGILFDEVCSSLTHSAEACDSHSFQLPHGGACAPLPRRLR